MTTPVFPYFPGLAWPVQRSVGIFDTTTQIAMSGKKATFPNRIQAQYKYTIAIDGLDSDGNFPNLTAQSEQTLIGFFNQLLGGALLFNFYDVNDSLATTQEFGVGDGTTVAFQLARAIGGWADYIYSPILASVTVPLLAGGTGTVANTAPLIYDNAGLVSSANYSISATGLVTFNTAPVAGHALTWTGNYYWLCNMDEDTLELAKIARSLAEMKKLSFTTRLL